MSNLKVIEEGRRAREIWAKRLGFHFRTLPLNPDGTQSMPKAKVTETAKAEAAAEAVKAKAETAKATAAKPEVKATPTNVGGAAAK